MNLLQRGRKGLTALVLVIVLMVATACSAGTATQSDRTTLPSSYQTTYQQLETGNTVAGQSFGDWVLRTGKGLIKDAFVRDENKLGVVITPQVRPDDVRSLARSLMQGFERNFPDRDLAVLMYAPDKQLIMTARYNHQTRQIEYQA